MTVAERIKQLRAAADLSQSGLSVKSGVPIGTIRDIEQGKRQPTFPTLRRLSKALGASLGDWSDCDEGPEPEAKRGRK